MFSGLDGLTARGEVLILIVLFCDSVSLTKQPPRLSVLAAKEKTIYFQIWYVTCLHSCRALGSQEMHSLVKAKGA